MGVMETVGFAAFFGDRLVAPSAARRCCRWRAAGRVAGGSWLTRDVVVIGAGVGGLAVAIRLAAAGHRVEVLERNAATGGKLASVRAAGATFDVGPSLLTLPHVFDELLALAGTSLAAEVELVRLDPQFHYHWPDGSSLAVPDGPDGRGWRVRGVPTRCRCGVAALRRAGPADLGRQRADVPRRADGRTAAAARPDALAARPRRHRPAAHAPRSGVAGLRRPAARAVGRPLRDLLGLVAVPGAGHAGLHPAHRARYGCWYPMGGLDALREALERAAATLGVEIRTGCDGRAHRNDRRRGDRRRAGGRHVRAGADRRRQRRRRAPLRRPAGRRPGAAPGPPGASVRRAGLVLLVGVARRDARPRPPQRLVLRRRPRRVRRASTPGGWPTTRRSTPASRSVTDPIQAPTGTRTGSCWSNTPPGIELDAVAEQRRSSTSSPAAASTCATGWRGAMSSRPLDWRRGTGAPAGRSTARRRTVGGRRSCVPATGVPWRAVPRRRVEPPRRRPAARADRRPHRRRHGRGRRPRRARRRAGRRGVRPLPRPSSAHVARAARRLPPIAPAPAPQRLISVVVPARDEADRIGPLLDAVVGAEASTR